MLRFLKFLIIAPIAILLLLFAFANRQFVAVSFDPFPAGDVPAFAFDAPLFIVLILAGMVGVLAGGAATWLAQGKHRRGERRNRAEADRWRAEADANRVPPNAAPPH